ncbi:MAG TPA: acetyltransferase [Desulfobacterales bacterium]|nr:acetyltransferase [Desulfobacterales bacterium]
MTQPIIIVGDGETAQLAWEYFTHDSNLPVAGFAVEAKFRKTERLYELPVVDLETVERRFPPRDHRAFVAISYTQLNRVRARVCGEMKARGYVLASYVSSRAFVWRTARIGENCFVLENNVIQHGVVIEDNVFLWSGNHVGHQTRIRRDTYIASHAVISGFCDIGESCFVGVNATFNDKIRVARDGVIGSGAVVVRDTEPGRVYVGNPAKPLAKSSYETFGVATG